MPPLSKISTELQGEIAFKRAQGQTFPQIAKALGIPQQTVRDVLRRDGVPALLKELRHRIRVTTAEKLQKITPDLLDLIRAEMSKEKPDYKGLDALFRSLWAAERTAGSVAGELLRSDQGLPVGLQIIVAPWAGPSASPTWAGQAKVIEAKDSDPGILSTLEDDDGQ